MWFHLTPNLFFLQSFGQRLDLLGMFFAKTYNQFTYRSGYFNISEVYT